MFGSTICSCALSKNIEIITIMNLHHGELSPLIRQPQHYHDDQDDEDGHDAKCNQWWGRAAVGTKNLDRMLH